MKRFARHIFGWATIAFVANLAGTFVLVGLLERGSTNDSYAEEGKLAGLLIFGTLWACVASFVTMVSYVRPATGSSFTPLQCGLAFAIATLPLSALLNAPSITPNPVAVLGGNLVKYDAILFATCFIEYFGLAVFVGLLLLRLARSATLSTINIVGWVWTGSAVLYVLQLPVALALSNKLH